MKVNFQMLKELMVITAERYPIYAKQYKDYFNALVSAGFNTGTSHRTYKVTWMVAKVTSLERKLYKYARNFNRWLPRPYYASL